MALVRRIISELTPAGLARICAPNAAAGFPPQTTLPVSLCLNVMLGEEQAHHGYAVRDLTELDVPLTHGDVMSTLAAAARWRD